MGSQLSDKNTDKTVEIEQRLDQLVNEMYPYPAYSMDIRIAYRSGLWYGMNLLG